MDCGNMMLVGSSPPTQRGYTPEPPSDHLSSRVYSGSSSILNNYFNTNNHTAAGRQKNMRGTTGKNVQSSSRSSDGSWRDPVWKPKSSNNVTFNSGDKYTNKRSYVESPETLSSQKILYGERPTSSKSMSGNPNKRPSSAKRYTFKPSYVDELLFGQKLTSPDFDAPWSGAEKRKSHNANSKDGDRAQSSRPGSRARVPRHSASYVDETLFGPQPVYPDWEAPWSKPDHRRVNIYDAFQHKVTIEHSDVKIVRPKSAVYLRKPRPVSSGKPPWK